MRPRPRGSLARAVFYRQRDAFSPSVVTTSPFRLRERSNFVKRFNAIGALRGNARSHFRLRKYLTHLVRGHREMRPAAAGATRRAHPALLRSGHLTSLASEASDDRCGLVHCVIEDHKVGESVALASLLHFVDDVVHRSEKQRGHLQHLRSGYAIPPPLVRKLLRCLSAILANDHRHHHAQLDPAEPIASRLANPIDLLSDGRGKANTRIV